jgi:tRNA(fMet)-specific endonuclease VapC
MADYLLDTCVFSDLWNPDKERHKAVTRYLQGIESGAIRYLSAITLGELRFGVCMAEACNHKRLAEAQASLRKAAEYPMLQVSRHTAEEYGRLKQELAACYLNSGGCAKRPRWVEDWSDGVSGKLLQLDENDIWICALAIERNLVLLTVDGDMERIARAVSPELLRVCCIQ